MVAREMWWILHKCEQTWGHIERMHIYSTGNENNLRGLERIWKIWNNFERYWFKMYFISTISKQYTKYIILMPLVGFSTQLETSLIYYYILLQPYII